MVGKERVKQGEQRDGKRNPRPMRRQGEKGKEKRWRLEGDQDRMNEGQIGW